ncbi:MAG TPA: serine acetyltransferase [Myxococcota bacterium]|nr:serine acetyltransferase [Myxococcota bacterium]HRY95674.1 serine acetyltransferase [Myxococcota bacterium]HSA24532.1 serine acetyltransferase [Myxococcota bacterium]
MPRAAPHQEAFELDQVVARLIASGADLARRQRPAGCRRMLPSRTALAEALEDLRAALFPGYHGLSDLDETSLRFHVGATLDRARLQLEEQVRRGLCFVCDLDPVRCPQCVSQAAELTRAFLSRLPDIRRLLAGDVRAAYEGDPAAASPDEAIFCYPGLQAITNYRLAHALHELEVPLIPRILTEFAHSATGIDIHPGARIGESFFIDHGTGVVIGETCEIGARVRLYQGVTLGAKSFPLDEDGKPIKGVPRHPIVEDEVIIYSGATILGRVRIGRGSVVGGNVWLTRDLPPGSRITQALAREQDFDAGGGI